MTKEKKELFSERVVAGRRTYFFDVKESQDGAKYLVISESKLVGEGDYEHNRIMIFQEHIPTFIEGLKKVTQFIMSCDKAKAYDIEEIRQKYPKAYMKWTKEEDDNLRNEYFKGKTIEELAMIFQRKPSAIRSRLQKLGLLNEDKIYGV